MSVLQYITVYGITLLSFLGLDSVWLGVIAPKLYRHYIGHLMATRPNFVAAAAFYLIFIFGLVVFVIVPALNKESLGHAALYGALFGLVTYATFDLTSQAVFKNWPTAITLIDMAWGTLLSAGVASVAYLIARAVI